MPESSGQELEELPTTATRAAATDRQREEEPELGTLVHAESRHELAGPGTICGAPRDLWSMTTSISAKGTTIS